MSADEKKKKKTSSESKKKPTVKKKTAKKKPEKAKVSKDIILIEKLTDEIKSMEDKHIRLKAEFDNFRRRKSSEIVRLLEYDGADVITSLLPVVDDFDRLMEAFEKQGKDNMDAIGDGIKMIAEKLRKILKDKKVEPFGEPGEILDAELHDAMMVQNDPDKEDNEILTVYEKGYQYKDKVLRHAKVVVNKK